MERFKIFPSIGVARVGGSPNGFFICPESPDSGGVEIGSDGQETELVNYKDTTGETGLIKKQAARFRIFELNSATNQYLPVDMSQVSVEWSVHLVNKKAAAQRGGAPPPSPPQTPLSLRPGSNNLLIDAGAKKIAGTNQTDVQLAGNFKGKDVTLGELKTDKDGNLIVLGGNGISGSVPAGSSIGGFYYSENWYDDTSDGSVNATMKLADGTVINNLNAWVIVGPPDFAPKVKAVVTLYDIMQNISVSPAQRPATPSFSADVLPVIDRFRSHKFVSELFGSFAFPFQNADLANTSAGNQSTRSDARDRLLRIGAQGGLSQYELTPYQLHILEKWVAGNFINDLNNPPGAGNDGDALTKTVLDTTVGQGFFPGIEAGIVTTSSSIYSEPFTIDHAKVSPGDITGLMALPWQADFLDCEQNWWPTQRPDRVIVGAARQSWDRGIAGYVDLVTNFNKLGFVKSSGQQQTEQERTL